MADGPAGPPGPPAGARATFDYSGHSVLVAGGSRGIGLEVARSFSAAGAAVTVTARREAPLAEAVAGFDGPAHAVAGDAGDAAHAATAVAASIERFGPLSVLVANVGGAPYAGPLLDAPPEVVAETFRRNVLAPLNFAREAWRQSMESHGGVVIVVGSVGGLRARAGNGPYNVAKAALHHLTRQLAIELAPAVRVVCLIPGVVRTDFARPLYEGREAELGGDLPLARLGEPADVAYLALTLAAPEAGWVTGAELLVDGGASLLSAGRTQPLMEASGR